METTKKWVEFDDVFDFSIENIDNFIFYQTLRQKVIYDLVKLTPICVKEQDHLYEYWLKMSHSRKYFVEQRWSESDMQVFRTNNPNDIVFSSSCEQIEFIGKSNQFYCLSHLSFHKFDCDTGQDLCLFKRGKTTPVINFAQSPSTEFVAVKIGYYTDKKAQHYVQFFKNEQNWSRFTNIEEATYFLTNDILAAIV